MHQELADDGIRTVALAPGLTDTPGMRAIVGEEYIARVAGQYPGGRIGQLNLPFSTPEETAAMAVTFLDHFPAQEYPHLAELTTEHLLRPGYDYGNEFGFGLDLILEGLERGRAAAGHDGEDAVAGLAQGPDALPGRGRVRAVVLVRRVQLVPDGDDALDVPHSLDDVLGPVGSGGGQGHDAVLHGGLRRSGCIWRRGRITRSVTSRRISSSGRLKMLSTST